MNDISPRAAAPAKRKGALHYVGVGLSLGLMGLVALIAVLVIALPMVSHATPYTVLTSSMTPSYPAGTLVVVKSVDVHQIRLGDVMTYQIKSGQPEVVTHRVIRIIEPTTPGGEPSFITKGDANSLPDSPAVKPVQVRGVVWYAVPYIGWVNNVVNGGLRNVIVPLVAGVLFLYAGFMIASGLVEARRRRAARTSAAASVVSDAPATSVPVVTAARAEESVEEDLHDEARELVGSLRS
ncbi:signal peptidase I [Lysinimonas soli]|uniref:Signal peptidase I n=1 Tax=Lysinimonas soli TaxID=1074233 RepID=A0ABW0NSV8_9MICO